MLKSAVLFVCLFIFGCSSEQFDALTEVGNESAPKTEKLSNSVVDVPTDQSTTNLLAVDLLNDDASALDTGYYVIGDNEEYLAGDQLGCLVVGAVDVIEECGEKNAQKYRARFWGDNQLLSEHHYFVFYVQVDEQTQQTQYLLDRSIFFEVDLDNVLEENVRPTDRADTNSPSEAEEPTNIDAEVNDGVGEEAVEDPEVDADEDIDGENEVDADVERDDDLDIELIPVVEPTVEDIIEDSILDVEFDF